MVERISRVKFYWVVNQEMVASLTPKGKDNPFPYSTMTSFLNVGDSRYFLMMYKAPDGQMKFTVDLCTGDGILVELERVSEKEVEGNRLSWKRFGKLAKEWYEGFSQMKEAA